MFWVNCSSLPLRCRGTGRPFNERNEHDNVLHTIMYLSLIIMKLGISVTKACLLPEPQSAKLFEIIPPSSLFSSHFIHSVN